MQQRVRGVVRPWASVGTVLTVADGLAVLVATAPSAPDLGIGPVLLAAVAGCVASRLTGLQRPRLVLSAFAELPRLTLSAGAASAVLVLTSPELSLDQGSGPAHALGYFLLVFALMATLRVLVYSVTRLARRTLRWSQPVVVVGSSDLGRRVTDVLLARPDTGLRLIGVVDCGRQLTARGLRLPHYGRIDNLAGVLAEHDVRTVVFACSDPPHEQPVEAIRDCVRSRRCVFVVAGTYLAGPHERSQVERVDGVRLVHLPRGGASPWTRLLRWVGRMLGVTSESSQGTHRGSQPATGSDQPEVHARELAR